MTWDVLQDINGNLQMIPHNDPVPDGWVIVVETANDKYLEYLASLTV